ncbi:DMT family transporter [Pseudophaeobacter flagellatus]|uniref:DMT family transporter n=1 Tax=Pseudophaeobacter flagellatus TaxID=2899119 RepID=UPI001E418F18|nr:DMT family transporter [Pseudophaeobacter flagellatus]MCD9148566.1 DMT family transporter [Pseudophaeobacter flagellatus]
MTSHIPFRVLGVVVLAMTLIVTGDAAGKTLTMAGASPFFVAWSRFAVAAVVLLPFSGLQAAELRGFLDWRILLRGLLIATGILCILTALRTEPIANVFGGFFVGPIVAFALSALVLKERADPSRVALLLVSFGGVLLVVKPGFGMQAGMGFAVLAGCFHGSYLVATRSLAGQYRPRFLLISQLIIGAVVLLPFTLEALPQSLDPTQTGLVLISALGSAAGNFLLVLVNRTTPANVVAPLIYSQLLAATVLGGVVFGTWPDWVALLGLCVIVLSGLSSLWLAGRRLAQP